MFSKEREFETLYETGLKKAVSKLTDSAYEVGRLLGLIWRKRFHTNCLWYIPDV